MTRKTTPEAPKVLAEALPPAEVLVRREAEIQRETIRMVSTEAVRAPVVPQRQAAEGVPNLTQGVDAGEKRGRGPFRVGLVVLIGIIAAVLLFGGAVAFISAGMAMAAAPVAGVATIGGIEAGFAMVGSIISMLAGLAVTAAIMGLHVFKF